MYSTNFGLRTSRSECGSFQKTGHVPADGVVQAAIMLSHRWPVGVGNVVEAHGNFHEHAIESQKDVEHLPRVAPGEGLSG
jgi:hypothetical protein